MANSKLLIIGIGHRRRMGKNTLATILRRELRDQVVEVKGFADPIKEVCHHIFNWAGLKSGAYYEKNALAKEEILPQLGLSPRDLYLKVGTMFRDLISESVWVDACLGNVDPRTEVLVIPDLRFQNEYEAIKRAGGICLKINNPFVEPVDELMDNNLEDAKWDLVVENDGSLGDLDIKAKNFIEGWIDGK